MPPSITAYGLPTGGAVSLTIDGAVSGQATLSRQASGGALTQIYSGVAVPFFLDVGDGLPAPLDANTPYQYQYTDSTGTVTSLYITPQNILQVQAEPITLLLVRLIQGYLNSLVFPGGIKKAEVTHAMPLGGSLNLPLVVVNLDLLQQGAVPIGQSNTVLPSILSAASGVPASGFTITGFANRLYRVSALCLNAVERDFYRDNLVGFFEAIYQTVLQPLGIDTEHRWQVSSGQIASDRQAMGPGFYYADVMMEFAGTFDITLMPTYGLISRITTTASYPGFAGVTYSDVISVPVSGA